VALVSWDVLFWEDVAGVAFAVVHDPVLAEDAVFKTSDCRIKRKLVPFCGWQTYNIIILKS
jgi:hypothetical protein